MPLKADSKIGPGKITEKDVEMTLHNGKATLDFPANIDSFPQMIEWLEGILDEIAFPVKARQQIMICADEIATNIASYAYPSGNGSISVAVTFDATQNELEVVFSDHGVPFDPLRHQPPDTSAPIENRDAGGLGILVVQRMMDHVEYRRDGDRNVLTLKKRASCPGKTDGCK